MKIKNTGKSPLSIEGGLIVEVGGIAEVKSVNKGLVKAGVITVMKKSRKAEAKKAEAEKAEAEKAEAKDAEAEDAKAKKAKAEKAE